MKHLVALAVMCCLNKGLAGQWTYTGDDAVGTLAHGESGWSLDVFREGLSLTVYGIFKEPSSLSPLPLDDSVDGGYVITTIGSDAFARCIQLSSVTLPDSMRDIQNSAFRDCQNLTNAVIKGSLSGIEDKAFADCPKLTGVTFRGAYLSGGKEPYLLYGSPGSMNVTTYIRSVFAPSWNQHVENGPVEGGAAVWQMYPIRIHPDSTNGVVWNEMFPYVVNINEVVGDGEGYHVDNGTLSLTVSDAAYLIIGNGVATNLAVSVPAGLLVFVTLSNVNINVSERIGLPAFGVASNAITWIRLAGSNTLAGGQNAAGLQVPQGANMVLSAVPPEAGSLYAAGGARGAGIGGAYRLNSGAVTISGGVVTAIGGDGGAGIGGGMIVWSEMVGGGGGDIVISGGAVTAVGNHGAAGIGDGEGGDGAAIIVSGGTVTASGGSSGGAGIGGDRGGGAGTISISGGVIDVRGVSGQGDGIGSGTHAHQSASAVTGSITGSNTYVVANMIASGILRQGGLIFDGGYGRLYEGGVTLLSGAAVPAGMCLVITNAQTFTVGEGATLTNNGIIDAFGELVVGGTLVNNGLIRAYDAFAVDGTLVNDGSACSIEPVGGGGTIIGGAPVLIGEAGSAANPVAADINAVAAGGPGYAFEGGCLTFFWSGHYLVHGTGEATANRICVSEGTATRLTLSNINIRVSSNYTCAFDVRRNAFATIMLVATNSLMSGLGAAGLHVPPDASVAIGIPLPASGERQVGALVAAGGASSAGIGGNLYESAGNIAISGGAVTAMGGGSAYIYGGAGIGGGHGGSGGRIVISGGTVIATGNYNAAAIGNGSGGSPASGAVSGNAFVVANTAVGGLEKQGGVIVEQASGAQYADVVAVVADTSLPAESCISVTNGQTLVVGQNVTFTNYGVITNAGTIIVYGTFINNGLIVGNAPLQVDVPPGVIERLEITAESVDLSWPDTPAPISIVYGKEALSDVWTEISGITSPTHIRVPLGRYRFFVRTLP